MNIANSKQPQLKRDGFPGERHAIVPFRIVRQALARPITQDLLPTAIGHFPNATGHYVTRSAGEVAHDVILIYCSEGDGWCRFAGHTHRLNAGSAVVIPAHTAHAYGTTKRQPWTIYWVHFTGKRIHDYLSVIGVSPEKPILRLEGMGEILHHFESLYGLLINGYTPANLVALSTALANFLGQITLHRRAPRTVNPTTMEQVQRTVPFMRQHLTSDVTISELARVAALSVPHYGALFKNLTGCSPKAFYLRLKMQEAARVLETTPASVRDVAAHLGIQDPYYFSRLFKKIMGSSPSTYRSQIV